MSEIFPQYVCLYICVFIIYIICLFNQCILSILSVAIHSTDHHMDNDDDDCGGDEVDNVQRGCLQI